jgi:predicted metalloprotease
VLFSDAGIWANFAHREQKILEQGDVEEGLNRATQIDDDRMPMRAQGYVFRFNHSADQRVR